METSGSDRDSMETGSTKSGASAPMDTSGDVSMDTAGDEGEAQSALVETVPIVGGSEFTEGGGSGSRGGSSAGGVGEGSSSGGLPPLDGGDPSTGLSEGERLRIEELEQVWEEEVKRLREQHDIPERTDPLSNPGMLQGIVDLAEELGIPAATTEEKESHLQGLLKIDAATAKIIVRAEEAKKAGQPRPAEAEFENMNPSGNEPDSGTPSVPSPPDASGLGSDDWFARLAQTEPDYGSDG